MPINLCSSVKFYSEEFGAVVTSPGFNLPTANTGTAVEEICYSPVSPMRILVVEDDDKIASFVVNGLKQSGFAVDRAKDGEQGLGFGLSISYDAAVLDLI